MTNKIKLYELVTKQEGGVSNSPFVIAVELYLKHKGLDFESVPLTFIDVGPTIKEVTGGKWAQVPTVIFPNGDIIYDSPEIAKYLDEKYPENPLVTVNSKCDKLIHDYGLISGPHAFKLVINDIFNMIDERNQKLFKDMAFEKKFESHEGPRELNIQQYTEGLKSVDNILSEQKFLNGDKPLIHDYNLISKIQSFRTVSHEAYEDLILKSSNKNFLRWVKDMDVVLNGYLANRKTV